ncbi:Gfo/Idh/MocA family oxidoreductase [bacterium]|nr:Gfo/Idh/MocA family oxidoreductase [bacterium]
MIKTLIIGCGRMGRRHISAVQSLTHKIIGVVDSSQESLDLTVKENNIKNSIIFKTLESALINEIPDLAVIATTADSHHDFTIKLANSGVKYILCEKPMAVSIAQCEEMIEVCNKSGTKLAINHPVRFLEADIEIKNLINSNKFGGLSAINISAGNFGLAMNGVHNIEMFRFLTDEQPQTIQAWFDEKTTPNPRGPEFFDRSGALRIKTKSGKVLSINSYAASGHGVIITYTSRNAQIVLDDETGQAQITVRKDEFLKNSTAQYAMPADYYSKDFKSSDLISSCAKVISSLLSESNYPDGETIINTIKIMSAAYTSAENGNIEIDILNYKLDKNRIFPWA